MGTVRDPYFWKRFSMAVHLDEEQQGRPALKHTDSWLERQKKKKSRRTCICWIFWLCFFGLVAGIVIVVLWLKSNGILDGRG